MHTSTTESVSLVTLAFSLVCGNRKRDGEQLMSAMNLALDHPGLIGIRAIKQLLCFRSGRLVASTVVYSLSTGIDEKKWTRETSEYNAKVCVCLCSYWGR